MTEIREIMSYLLGSDHNMVISGSRAELKRFGLSQIAATFNLIQDGCREGHFTDLYLQPRFMAGLGLQLFTMLLTGRIRLPDGLWYQANTSTLMVDGQYAGFVIIRHMPSASEIYMCSLLKEFRGNRLGELMIRNALAASVPDGRLVISDCLPASLSMMAVLERIGFVAVPQENPATARRFHYLIALR